MKDKPYTGESSYGPYFLYQVKDQSEVELAFLAPAEIHQQILEAGLKAGDSFKLAKLAVQNGKKVSSRLVFEVLKKVEPVQATSSVASDNIPFEMPDDGFKELMKRYVEEAVEIVKNVNSISWQNEDVRSIALTMFSQRSRVS